jgi:uncharacterized protein (DUF2267 family)
MRYAPFLTTVEQTAGITREEAERAVRATLETLAERISGGEARDIALFLPKELRPLLDPVPEPAEAFGLDEFLRRVAEREGVDRDTAFDHARAVFTALGVAVAPGELSDMVAQLPREFAPLLQTAGIARRRAMAAGDLVGRVAELAGLDRDDAQRATEAVLEALAVRISDGEVDDLERELPPNLRPALDRGVQESRAARPMSPDEFVALVAEREGVGADEAREHTRAVFTALREVISGKEFHDVASQLSDDYAPLLAASGR